MICRPQALAANISELLVWVFTTASLRLYWHGAHMHQPPLVLTLLWCAKAAIAVLLAILQASLTFQHADLSFQVCPITPNHCLSVRLLRHCCHCHDCVCCFVVHNLAQSAMPCEKVTTTSACHHNIGMCKLMTSTPVAQNMFGCHCMLALCAQDVG